MSSKKLFAIGVLILLVSVILLGGCGAEPAPTPAAPDEEASPTEPAVAADELDCEGFGEGGKCRVVLVNSFLGNDYRIQMQRAAEAASKYEPYASVMDFEILNTENTPEAQRAGVENLLAEGVDAILLNAVDNTSMNDLVEKACDQGVKVVTFDITAKPGACEYAIDFDFYNWAVDAGRWLGLATGADERQINVIMDHGLQGVQIADDIYQGGLDGLILAAGGAEENINIVGEYYGEFAEGVQEPLVSAILAANPDKQIDVVFTQGYCTTIVSAFENAGLDYTPYMYCQNYNSNCVLCAQEGVDCLVNMTTNAGSIGALDTAYRLIKGETPPKQQPWPTSYGVTQEGFEFETAGQNVEFVMLEEGVNAFPELPPGFQPFWNWPGAEVQITLEEAAGLEEAPPTEPPSAAEPDCEGFGEGGKCRTVLVNSFLGNDYRIQMQRAAEAASKYEPYASVIDFEILNTENTPEAQRAGLENLIAEGVDAILLNAVDNTSVNDVVEKACDEGVKVVTFDITAKPGACEKAIDFGFCDWAFDAGQWEALAAGADQHPINVIMDKGLQGVDIADDIYSCGLEGMYNVAPKENINIVGEYYGEFAEGVQEPLISAILAANPDKKIDVVHTQGYCTTVKSAFENAGLDYLPIMYCQGYNANSVLCAEEGVDCVVQLDTFAGSIGSLDTAYRWFMGETIEEPIVWPTDFGVTIPGIDVTLRTPNAKIAPIEIGVNAFPDLPPGFGPLYNWPGAYVQITLEEATGVDQ